MLDLIEQTRPQFFTGRSMLLHAAAVPIAGVFSYAVTLLKLREVNWQSGIRAVKVIGKKMWQRRRVAVDEPEGAAEESGEMKGKSTGSPKKRGKFSKFKANIREVIFFCLCRILVESC